MIVKVAGKSIIATFLSGLFFLHCSVAVRCSEEDPNARRYGGYPQIRKREISSKTLPIELPHQVLAEKSTRQDQNRSSSFSWNVKDLRSQHQTPKRSKRYAEFDISHHQLQNDEQKRGSHFFPLRGKKENDPDMYHDLPMNVNTYLDTVKGRTLDDLGLSNGNGFFSDEENKRASSFMAMRGKKLLAGQSHETSITDDSAPQNFENGALNENINVDALFNDLYKSDLTVKRARTFIPMRGRKNDENDAAQESNSQTLNHNRNELRIQKRAPAFIPARGRKSDQPEMSINIPDTPEDVLSENYIPTDDDYANTEYKRPSAFLPMRGRKVSSDDLYQTSPLEDSIKSTNSYNIEILTSEDENSSDPDATFLSQLYKRASAFVPMRGRKSSLNSNRVSYYRLQYPPLVGGLGSSYMAEARPFENKRPSSFHALRGKKRRYSIDWDSMKRAFFATRGKRMVNSMSSTLNPKDLSTKDFNSAEYSEDTNSSKQEKTRQKRSMSGKMKYYKPVTAFKRPLSFYATRGKRLHGDLIDSEAVFLPH